MCIDVPNKEGQSRNQPLDGIKAERERITSAGQRKGGGGAESPGGLQRSVLWGRGTGGLCSRTGGGGLVQQKSPGVCRGQCRREGGGEAEARRG